MVERRPPPESPSSPSPRPRASSIFEPLEVSVFAASESVLAGARIAVVSPSADVGPSSPGSQVNSRTASRKRSVAAIVSDGPSISTRMPVSIGSVSSRPAATATCETARAKTSGASWPDDRRHLGQLRVVLGGHRREAEPGVAADQRGAGTLDRDVDRVRREGPGDVGEEPARDQRAAAVADHRRDLDPGRDLVVEPRHRQRAVVRRIQQDAAEHGHRGPAGQAARDEGHRVGEGVTLHAELHRCPPGIGAGPGRVVTVERDRGVRHFGPVQRSGRHRSPTLIFL